MAANPAQVSWMMLNVKMVFFGNTFKMCCFSLWLSFWVGIVKTIGAGWALICGVAVFWWDILFGFLDDCYPFETCNLNDDEQKVYFPLFLLLLFPWKNVNSVLLGTQQWNRQTANVGESLNRDKNWLLSTL